METELSESSGSADEEDLEVQSGRRIPLEDLPPLPKRSAAYSSEPWMGVCIVFILSAMLIRATQGGGLRATVTLIWTEAAVAVLSMFYLLFGGAGVVRRSAKTCYPIPPQVEERIRQGRSCKGLRNVRGPEGSRTLGSYCVRCLVWRPPSKDREVHHCNVCQRCVTGFDHHCGVFGRCIVQGNMPCFVALIAMMFCGMTTAMIAAGASAEPAHGP